MEQNTDILDEVKRRVACCRSNLLFSRLLTIETFVRHDDSLDVLGDEKIKCFMLLYV